MQCPAELNTFDTARALACIAKRVGERGGKEAKQILVSAFEGAIRSGLPLLRTFLSHRHMAIVEGITELYIALFEAYKSHLGLPFIQETMVYVLTPLHNLLLKNILRVRLCVSVGEEPLLEFLGAKWSISALHSRVPIPLRWP